MASPVSLCPIPTGFSYVKSYFFWCWFPYSIKFDSNPRSKKRFIVSFAVGDFWQGKEGWVYVFCLLATPKFGTFKFLPLILCILTVRILKARYVTTEVYITNSTSLLLLLVFSHNRFISLFEPLAQKKSFLRNVRWISEGLNFPHVFYIQNYNIT